jgi:hypothetical protein
MLGSCGLTLGFTSLAQNGILDRDPMMFEQDSIANQLDNLALSWLQRGWTNLSPTSRTSVPVAKAFIFCIRALPSESRRYWISVPWPVYSIVLFSIRLAVPLRSLSFDTQCFATLSRRSAHIWTQTVRQIDGDHLHPSQVRQACWIAIATLAGQLVSS